MKVIKGKFYLQFSDETVEECLNAHLCGGYDSIAEAIEDSNIIEYPGLKFKVLNANLETVFESETK